VLPAALSAPAAPTFVFVWSPALLSPVAVSCVETLVGFCRGGRRRGRRAAAVGGPGGHHVGVRLVAARIVARSGDLDGRVDGDVRRRVRLVAGGVSCPVVST
jgi:hypothetical protein